MRALMRSLIRRALALLALGAGLATAAPCLEVGPKQGTLGFEGTQAGAPFAGSFAQWKATLCFDSADLAASRFEVTVTTASATSGDSERDTALVDEPFFWSKKFPEARYVTTRFVLDKDGGFHADGALTLRGVTKPVALVFKWQPGLALEGSATVSRLAFGVGQGEWSDTEWIGDQVTVRFRISLGR